VAKFRIIENLLQRSPGAAIRSQAFADIAIESRTGARTFHRGLISVLAVVAMERCARSVG
jgi:hypothetical protein